MTDIEKLAGSLSEAQRAYLTTKAQWRQPRIYSQSRWMTFPPSNTHRVLCEQGLTNRGGQILDLGLRVREYLEKQDG